MAAQSSSTPNAIDATSAGPPAPGQLSVLTSFAVAASIIPVPIVPDRIVNRVRGAIAHNTASRHGLSLTKDGRAVLAAPGGTDRAIAIRAAEALIAAVLKRLGPLGAAVPMVRGVETFALGHLLDRYISHARTERSVRIQADEARRVRTLIDRAIVRALSPNLRPATAMLPGPVEDTRDTLTRWTDTALLTGAALPSYLQRRLDAAFDQVLAEAEAAGG
jgi:hypothetical protein